MSLIKDYLYHKSNMEQLEVLIAREQLMEDIDCIIESHFAEVEYKPAHGTDLVYITDELIRQLCDAVCRNFPAQ